ncbi:FAD-dependent monooxygenase [Nocardiopsis mangrovi]|uniref:FAD-dependent monooxygenase n=1 Tax=Nocardiopsis mangrovi TaxID=1179818 RepID=A0ABV9DUQ1_9ACTN
MTTHTADVLIIGAGPTGLTLAVDLARRGVHAVLVEAAPAIPRQSRGKGLQPRTLEVLDDLGVIEEVLAHGRWRQRTTLYKDRTELADLGTGFAEPRSDVPYPNIVMQPQWRTSGILAERLRDLGGEIRFGTRLTGFTDGADGVRATLAATDAAEEQVHARYLVGCDGGRSLVRRTLGVGFAGVTRETHRYLLGDVTVPGWSPEEDEAVRSYAWLASDGSFLGLAGLPGTGQWQIGADVPADAAGLEPSLPALQRLWDERTGRTDVRLGEATWLSDFTVNTRMVDAYRRGRVLLAGDAAHVHPPTGGQGMNTGIQDAYNLGWKLAARLHGGGEDLIDGYQAERMPVARGVLEKSTDILDVVMSPNRAVAFMVQRVALPLLSIPAVNRALIGKVSQTDIGYRDSPLVADDLSGGRVRAGDRAPDALITDAATGAHMRLFDVFRGPRATLLLFGERAAARLSGADLPSHLDTCLVTDGPVPAGWEGKTVRDRGRTARRAYRPAPGTALLIRPDGYVGWRTRAPTPAAVRDRAALYEGVSGPLSGSAL